VVEAGFLGPDRDRVPFFLLPKKTDSFGPHDAAWELRGLYS